MLTDGSEALDGDASAVERHAKFGRCDFTGHGDAETRGADLVEWDAADRAGQAHGAPDLVLDPGHTLLVGAHVGTRDVLGEAADCMGERSDQLLLLFRAGGRVGADPRLSAAVRQTGRGVL